MTEEWYAYTRGRNEKSVTWLLANGADSGHCMFAIAWYDDVKAAALFSKYGANVNFKDREGNTALFYAVKKKYKIDDIGLLLKFGADPDIENQQGISARKLAEMNRQRKILGLFTP